MNQYTRLLKEKTEELENFKVFADDFETIIERRMVLTKSVIEVTGIQFKCTYTRFNECTYILVEWVIDDIAQPGIVVCLTNLVLWYGMTDRWIDIPELVSMLNTTIDEIVTELKSL